MLTSADPVVASDYVICTTLRKVAEIFDPELIWAPQRRYDGVPLFEALQRYRRPSPDQPRRHVYYHHIIVRIPEKDYISDDRLEGGTGRRTLLRELQQRHQQALPDTLNAAPIRYRIEPHSTLKSGEVQCLFGRAIYVPTAGEAPAHYIQVSNKSPHQWREIGHIHAAQRLTLLNGDVRTSSAVITAWPFSNGESILIITHADQPPTAQVLAEPQGCLTVTCDDLGDYTVLDKRGRNIRLRIINADAYHYLSHSAPFGDVDHSSAIVAETPPLTMPEEGVPAIDPWGRKEPVLGFPGDTEFQANSPLPLPEPSLPPMVPASHRTLPPQDVLLEPLPALPAGLLVEKTWIPQPTSTHIQVIGIALHRLSTYTGTGLQAWRIGFDKLGRLVHNQHGDAVAWIEVDNTDHITGEYEGNNTQLQIPGQWQPFTGTPNPWAFYAAPESMNAHYLGWMKLPRALILPIPHWRSTSFGRGADVDIAPGLLSDPEALRWDMHRTHPPNANAEHLGLSRQHLRVESRDYDWWVQLESQNMPSYCLTAEGDLWDVLTPRVHITTTAQPGTLLVAGGYVLSLGHCLAQRPEHARQ